MCDPTGGFLTAAAAAVSAFGQISQASAASSTAKANANIARTNATIKEQAATDAIQRGADSGAIARQKAKQATASYRAAKGSSGTLVDTGTNLDIQEQNAGTGELNALLIQNNAEREAYGYKVGAVTDRMQGDSFSRQAKSAWTNGLISAGGTLVTGAANNPGWFGSNKITDPNARLPWLN